jgi:hypothetical protein
VKIGFRGSALGFGEGALSAAFAPIPPARAQREGGPGGEWRGSLRSRDLVACALAPEESLPSRSTFRPRPDLFRPVMALAAGEAPAVKDRGGRTKSAPDGGRRDKGDPRERLGRPALVRAGGVPPRPHHTDSRRASPPGPPSRSARTGGTLAALGLRAGFFTGEPNRKFESQTRKKPACSAGSPAGFRARELRAPGPAAAVRRSAANEATPIFMRCAPHRLPASLSSIKSPSALDGSREGRP